MAPRPGHPVLRILLDENLGSVHLADRLRRAGHDVESPGGAGLRTAPDARVMIHAIAEARVVLTRDNGDFGDLHDLIRAAGGHHPGIMVVRYDGDPRHNMTERAIATAVGKLESAGMAVAGGLHVLDHWR